ncbi:NmrA-like family domain-containing protein [Lachnellula suecica]|uniref:NmrA-like family domain-containing protein n=1 Tax=Lachnellula suecica TaxID=602035 RepID=A0A8T9CSN2_9HELO|nr:NmrA-like family domain-containing protein [Lachnellula suecica]
MAPTFLITGATGEQGGATARFLLAEGATIHALVRDPSSSAAQALKNAGAIVFKGDFDDVTAVKSATSGVSGVFLNPQLHENQRQQAQNFIDAALSSKTVKTIVLSTAFFTGTPSIWEVATPDIYQYYTGKGAIEEAVRSAGFENYTILRPSWLMHNYLQPGSTLHFPELAPDGILAHIYKKDRRMAHLDAADIGKFAAAALLDPVKFSGHEIELGNENLTIEEAAEHLRDASGVDITVHLRTEEETVAMQPKVATMGFQKLANEKELTIDGKALETKYGIKLTTLAEYFERHKDALLKSLPAPN